MSQLLSEPARTPLYDLHVALGARIVPFAGYAMPLQYLAGIVTEHLHTRASAGLFDVSHMGQAHLSGPNAAARLETLVPGDIQSLAPGAMRYTQFTDQSGNLLDDLIVTRLPGDDERLFIICNAGEKTNDFARMAAALPDLRLDVLSDQALIALQGPMAARVLAGLVPGVDALPFMNARAFEWHDTPLFISRSGYTGEDGFEISLPASQARVFAERLLHDPDVAAIGLGARDSLRLEAGLCLYGHDINTTTDPISAGLLWSISKRRRMDGGFAGAAQVLQIIASGAARKRVGLLPEGRVPAREGAVVTAPDGTPVGIVTSGGFSPSLSRPIAMGYVGKDFASLGTELRVIVRDKPIVAHVAAMPFVPHHYFRG